MMLLFDGFFIHYASILKYGLFERRGESGFYVCSGEISSVLYMMQAQADKNEKE